MTLAEYISPITDITPYIGTRPFYGVRYNPLKITRERFLSLAKMQLKPCPFNAYGFYAGAEPSGNDPLHMAGGYYIQEPSAMSAVTALKLQPTDRVLDMCAAPGSKATAIAPLCDILVANEINPQRCRALIGNIERMGISNALITSSDSAAISSAFAGYFDKVLVDSPCSGEGMFRKHPEILSSWSEDLVKMCAKRSAQVLENAAETVKNGGRLVYSTCTYNSDENEKLILAFLRRHPEFELADTGISGGSRALYGLESARRIFIKDGGEGHFVCAMVRRAGAAACRIKPYKTVRRDSALCDVTAAPLRFLKPHEVGYAQFCDVHYALHTSLPEVKGVRVMRPGVKLGQQHGRVFKPEHHLFTAAAIDTVNTVNADPYKFMRGDEIGVPSDLRGFCAVLYEGMTLGFGKASNGILKNHYPKGLRLL